MNLGFDTGGAALLHDQATVLGTAGARWRRSSAPSPIRGEPVRVALVWTDAPGATIGRAYVNDLEPAW